MTHVAVCFFGITRSLGTTLSSIEENVLAPAREVGTLRVYAHLFRQEAIVNTRSGENGLVDLEEHRLLPCDWLELEEPEHCLPTWDFEGLKSAGDAWSDDFRSLRNLVHQLHSLNRVTDIALSEGADLCVFARPDLYYHDSLAPTLHRAAVSRKDSVFLPFWGNWNGMYNDRFAICKGTQAISAYGKRIEDAKRFVSETGTPLHAEYLLRFRLDRARLKVRRLSARASRIRLGGRVQEEDFRDQIKVARRRQLRAPLVQIAKFLGVADLLKEKFTRKRD